MTTTDDTLARARERLAALRAAEGAATAGPWARCGCGACSNVFGAGGEVFVHTAPDITVVDPVPDDGRPDASAIVALRNAAPALLDLADAVARLAGREPDRRGEPWWLAQDECTAYCIGCLEEAGMCKRGAEDVVHAPDCPALAIDAALARLAGEG